MPTPPEQKLATVSGVIHVAFTDMGGIQIVTLDGLTLTLSGTETASLAGLDGAQVEVRGTWDSGELVVSDFLVQRVGGANVLDGVLTMLVDDETGDIGYGISLTRGSLVLLSDPPEALLAHVGQRLWLTDPADGQPLVFGIIGPQTE
ncbi:MAG TPA: hypothetical protein VLN49_01055 [Gemmatimonadaceae bacterium]|nr:hypothetical protein [Gemmatimonadaceae bacterium]